MLNRIKQISGVDDTFALAQQAMEDDRKSIQTQGVGLWIRAVFCIGIFWASVSMSTIGWQGIGFPLLLGAAIGIILGLANSNNANICMRTLAENSHGISDPKYKMYPKSTIRSAWWWLIVLSLFDMVIMFSSFTYILDFTEFIPTNNKATSKYEEQVKVHQKNIQHYNKLLTSETLTAQEKADYRYFIGQETRAITDLREEGAKEKAAFISKETGFKDNAVFGGRILSFLIIFIFCFASYFKHSLGIQLDIDSDGKYDGKVGITNLDSTKGYSPEKLKKKLSGEKNPHVKYKAKAAKFKLFSKSKTTKKRKSNTKKGKKNHPIPQDTHVHTSPYQEIPQEDDDDIFDFVE